MHTSSPNFEGRCFCRPKIARGATEHAATAKVHLAIQPGGDTYLEQFLLLRGEAAQPLPLLFLLNKKHKVVHVKTNFAPIQRPHMMKVGNLFFSFCASFFSKRDDRWMVTSSKRKVKSALS